MTRNYLLRDGHAGDAGPDRSLVTKFHPVIEYNSPEPLSGSIHAVEANNGADSGRSARCPFPPEKASQGSFAPAITRFLSGHSDAETLTELRYAVMQWMLDADTGPALHRVLGLGTRRSARRERRDALLREAAALIPGRLSEKARALSEVARLVEVRRSARWSRTGVPDTADPVERLVFQAGRLEAIPSTLVQLRSILNAESHSPAHHHCTTGDECR